MTPIGREGHNALGLHPCVGYYDEPGETHLVYDPGWGATPCLICWSPLGGTEGDNAGGNIRTHNVYHGDGTLSLFYRTHISCAETHPDEIEKLDASVMHGERGAYDAVTGTLRDCLTEDGTPKRSYATRGEAFAWAQEASRQNLDGRLVAYECRECGRFHVGHGKKR